MDGKAAVLATEELGLDADTDSLAADEDSLAAEDDSLAVVSSSAE